jgi:transposase
MEQYIGMDAHSKTSVFVVLNSKGQELQSKRINTSEGEIVKFLQNLKGKKHLTFEESQLSRWLHVVIKDQVDELVVCNPSFIAKRSGPKNDYLDAHHLAQQLRGGFLSPVFHDDSQLSDLRKIVSSYEDLIADLVRIKNRFKAHYISRGISVKGKKVYKDTDKIKELDPASQFVARQQILQIAALEQMREVFKERFEKNMENIREIEVLATIPGISAIRANIIAAAVCDPRRFANKNKFWSYCMLVKHDRQSDGRSYGKVASFGKSNLKKVFMGATLDVMKKDCELRRGYELQRQKGLDPQAARKNLARRLAAISLALMKTGKSYQENRTKAKSKNLN